MDCLEFKDERILYVYGELTNAAAFESHLEHCSACHESLRSMKRVRSLYGSSRTPSMPASMRERPAPIRKIILAFAAAGAAAAIMWTLWPSEAIVTPMPTHPPSQAVNWQRVERTVSRELARLQRDLEFQELVRKGSR